MKTSSVSTTFMLMACIAFQSHAMESTLPRTKSSPTLMQRFSSLVQGLPTCRLATKLFVATALALSPEAMGRPLSNPTTTSSSTIDLIETPFPNNFAEALSTVAFGPNDMVAAGGIDLISIFSRSAPENNTFISLPSYGNCSGITNLIFNNQGTQLALATSTSLCIYDLLEKKITHEFPVNVWGPLFVANGIQVVARGQNYTVLCDLETNEATPVPIDGAAVGAVSGLAQLFGHKNLFVMDNPQGTLVWDLNDPAGAQQVGISNEYLTLFGATRDQLVSWSKPLPGGRTILLTDGKNTTTIEVDDLLNNVMYCKETNQIFFTTANPEKNIAMQISALNRTNNAITSLAIFPGDTAYNTPWLSPEGCQLLMLAGGDAKTLKFYYADLPQLLESSASLQN